MGVRFQIDPGAPPSEIIIHLRMLDKENLQQQEALGIVGVNLLFGAFYLHRDPETLISALHDDLTAERVHRPPCADRHDVEMCVQVDARLRPGADIGEKAKVGNFCEVKNAVLEEGAKVNHLTYVGDALVGAKANIGAGTITCNYDGFSKHRTNIGAGAFIGSNSSLVAPLTIGEGAYVASGSVITADIPADALAFGRARQETKEGRASRLRALKKAVS
jgi:tetrahydrodipicolinate N-succinyltransferase